MPQRYAQAILKHLAGRKYQPLTERQLARQMGIAEEDYNTFREAVKILRDAGQVVLGARNALTLPEMASRIVGVFRANRRGFGFVIPDSPTSHGDLFIPPDAAGGAMNGDHVAAVVRRRGRREGKMVAEGHVAEILRRGNNQVVGTLDHTKGTWFVIPEGKGIFTPVVVADIGAAGPPAGTKVVVEITEYPAESGVLPSGVIVENLGEAGPTAVETIAIIKAHGFSEKFTEEALEDARRAIEAFAPTDFNSRRDLTGEIIVTIDPADARDFDDAVSLTHNGDGTVTLGVHIADVSYFVKEGVQLDTEALARGTSVYFPRRVLPMLPEVLSNGVCSLQQGKNRYCKSAFITYDSKGKVLERKLFESVIRSTKRLTYQQAQEICDGKTGGYDGKVVELVRNMEKLARIIEARRFEEGMLELELPDVELVFDEQHRVIDAVPEDHSYSHTIIEMFMIEANEAVASLLHSAGLSFLRRVHPQPDETSSRDLATFVRACGHKIPKDLSRKDMQALLKSVKGLPESYAVNLALLKMFQQAEYAPMRLGHYALASRDYCHFTSPIRRYPDLTVHRLVAEYCRRQLVGARRRPCPSEGGGSAPPLPESAEDLEALVKLGEHCTSTERHAEGAEDELRMVLLLQHLESKIGEEFDGVITGVTNFGMFVQMPRYLIDGLIRMEHLGDDWWELDAVRGQIKGERTGIRYRIGDIVPVVIAGVDIPRRELDLSLAKFAGKRGKPAGKPGKISVKLGKPAAKPGKPAAKPGKAAAKPGKAVAKPGKAVAMEKKSKMKRTRKRR